MAVVQISKIQVRRGKKSQTNMPQLSGGEFGWTVDTQQLYIGNGSVAEGAPFVGNTEVLTQNSNIFELLGTYTYKGHSTLIPQTNFSRTLQEKLDDFVSVRDFGVKDNNDTVQTISQRTVAIQNALDQLFLKEDKNKPISRRALVFPAGEYTIDDTLKIPSYANIVGEGTGKTVLIQTNQAKSLFQTVAVTSTPGSYVYLEQMDSTNYPRDLRVYGMTFKRGGATTIGTPIWVLDCLVNGEFEDCQFIGTWLNNDGEDDNDCAIQVRSKASTSTRSITFLHCEFSNVSSAVYSDYESSEVVFDGCSFDRMYRGLTLAKNSTGDGGQALPPTHYTVRNSVFSSIDAEAWKVFDTLGVGSAIGHVSRSNKFYDVGNNNQGQSNPSVPVLDFRTDNCESINDFFERHIEVNSPASAGVAYVPDVLGPAVISYTSQSDTLVFNTQTSNPKTLCKVPLWTGVKVVIDYTIKKPSFNLYRAGQITVHAHPDMAVLGSLVVPLVSDDFNFVGTSEQTTQRVGGNINFTAVTAQLSATTLDLNALPITRPTLLIKYTNPTGPGGNAVMEYTVRVFSGHTEI